VSSTPSIFNVEGDIVSSEYTTGEVVASTQRAGVSGDLVSVIASWATGITLAGHTNPIRDVHSRLRAIIPEQPDGELPSGVEEMSILIKLDTNVQYLTLAIYLISNNMFSSENLSKMVECLQSLGHGRILGPLLSVKTSTVCAFAEKLFIAAVKAENIGIVKEVLNGDVDPNRWDEYGFDTSLSYTPLQNVATKGNIELVQLLLEAGAEVNALAAGEYGRTAL
jgi:hypothetical protein